MSFLDLFGDIRNVLHELETDYELKIDQAAIDQVMSTLAANATDVHHNRFSHLHVPASTFGGSAAAQELGGHHLRAHEVIRETLQGVLDDLNGFRDGLRRAEGLIQGADETAAADLDRKRAADILVAASHRDEGDRRNHDARNHYLGEGGGDR